MRRDHRTLRPKTEPKDKEYLDAYIENCKQTALQESQRVMYADICAKIALYCEGYQTPIPLGISDDSLSNFVKENFHQFSLNKFQVKKDENNIIFFSDNRVGEMKRGYIAEFTKAKKTMSPEHSSNPRHEKLEWGVKHWLNKWQKNKYFWEQVMVPTIEYMLMYNRGFIRQDYDSFKIRGIDNMGDIAIDYFHPCSVLMDPYPEKKHTLNSRFVIPFKKMPLWDAQLLVESLGGDPGKVVADSEYDEIMGGNTGLQFARDIPNEEFVTFFYPEWKQLSLDKIGLGTVDVDEKGNLNKRELKALNSFCYQALYNSTLGTINFKLNKYADPKQSDDYQFACIPLEDEHSDITVLGLSRIGKALVIQDLLNVVLTVFLNNARAASIVRGFIAGKLVDSWGEDSKKILKDLVNIGGLYKADFEALGIQDIKQVIQMLEMPTAANAMINDLLVIIDNVIKRQTIRKEVLTGQLPNKSSEQMSGTLARELKDSNETLLQPIIQNIEWAAGKCYRYQYNILAEEFGEDEWVQVTEGSKTDPKYIPIAAEWNLEKFNDYIQRQYLDVPLEQATKQFGEHSEVIMEVDAKEEEGNDPFTGQKVPIFRDRQTGRILTNKEVDERTTIYINSLMDRKNGKKHVFDFKVDLVFGVDDSKYEDKIIASQLFQKNPDSLVLFGIFLEMQGGYWADNKDQIIEDFKNEKDILKMVAMIEELGPEFIGILQKFIQAYQAQQMAKSQQEKAGTGGGAQPNAQQQQVPQQAGVMAG